jgi:phage terminase large subunit GpA-like protein
VAKISQKILAAMQPPPNLSIDEWADLYRRLSPEASAEPGFWSTDRAPYQRGMMQAISDPTVERVVFMTGAQIGKTEIINNAVGYFIDQSPSPMLIVQPTLEMAKMWSNDRLAPMLRDTPALKGKVADARSRDSGNTLYQKSFPGGYLAIVGANSAAGLASRPVRSVFFDEVDRYPPSAGSEGDPINLGIARTKTFTHNRKIVMVSTPTNKGASRIETAFNQSDQRYYHVPCPDCGHSQTLKWSNVHWQKDRPETAEYICEECGCAWDDAKRYRAIKGGEWIAAEPFNGTAGFHLSGLYSPWTPLGDIAQDFLNAKALPDTLRVFVNTTLAECFEDAGETVDDYDVAQRAEEFGPRVDKRVVVVTAGIDVQDDRLEIECVGWCRSEESFSLDYATLYGDPSTPQLWQDLDAHLAQKWDTEDGRVLQIRSACIDSGGHYTKAVYDFVRPREGKRVFAIKGMAGESRPIVSRPSRNNIGKIRLFTLGVDNIKSLIFSRLQIQSEGPGFCHFPNDRPDEYFKQLAASEKIVTKFHKGFPRREFIKTRTRNEALDCRVYATGALAILNLNLDTLADRASQSVRQDEDVPKNTPLRRPQRRGDFVNGWR